MSWGLLRLFSVGLAFTSPRCTAGWLQSPVLGSTLDSDPAPARLSLATGLFGLRTGEHARGPADSADHIPPGPGIETIPVGFCGQSRPNLTHASTVRRVDYATITRALPAGSTEPVAETARQSPTVNEVSPTGTT